MTLNQVAYWNLVETERHNKEQEVIGHKQAAASASHAAAAHRQAAVAEALLPFNMASAYAGAYSKVIGAEVSRYLAPAQYYQTASQGVKNLSGDISVGFSGFSIKSTVPGMLDWFDLTPSSPDINAGVSNQFSIPTSSGNTVDLLPGLGSVNYVAAPNWLTRDTQPVQYVQPVTPITDPNTKVTSRNYVSGPMSQPLNYVYSNNGN